MEAGCASSRFDDHSTEDFCFEVPIINLDLEKTEVEVLFVNNNVNAETSKYVTYSESIAIEETVDIINVKKKLLTEELGEESIPIVIEDEEKAIDLDAEINNKIINKNDKNLQEIDTTIDLDEETDSVTVLDGNGTDSDVIILDGNKALNMIKDVDLEITALDSEINNEIKNNNVKSLKEIDATIDIEEDTDNVTVLNENRTDSDVIILDGNKTDTETTITLNDEINELTQNKYKNTDVIDVENDTDCNIVENSVNIDSESIKEFKELIKKCLSMRNSAGMSRVINRTLLVIYKNVDERYKKSDKFRKVIANTSTLLDVEPERKFSHIKNLCDCMKLHKTKKKVPFITLDKRKETEQSTIIPKKRLKLDDVIDLDDDSTKDTQCVTAVKRTKNNYPVGKVYPSIDLDSSDDEVIVDDDVILLNKENTETDRNRNNKKPNREVKKCKNYKKSRKVGRSRKCASEKQNASKVCQNICVENGVSDPGMLLEPRMSVPVEMPDYNQTKIDAIERRIAYLKLQLEKMEEAEVLTDSYSSPYLVCEQIKTTIVELYKQLCQITGTEVTKRHEVRLQVVPGHAEGPVRCLEDFLNDNIDTDGNPPFPDMADVTQCVYTANYKYNLQWSSAQILNEAHALFTQFGKSMQKRRQKREWKDLMSLVKREVIDPADDDPALQARLEENKRIAKRNELDLLDRFAQIEHGIFPASEQGLRLRVHESDESDEDSDAQDPDDNNDAANLQNPRTDITETAPSETANGEGFETATENAEHPLNKLQVTAIQLHGEATVCLKQSGVICNTTKIADNIKYGSTLSASNIGKIVIQPTIQYLPDKNKTLNPNTEFSSEYSRFLNTRDDGGTVLPKIKRLPQNKVIPNTETSPEINSATQSTKCNETDLERAAKIAEDILNLVQSDMGNGNNGLTNNLSHINNINPSVRLTQLNLNDLYKDVNTNEDIKQSTELNNTSDNLTSNVLEKEMDVKTEELRIIKPEPLDIPRMLEELGEGFTATIFDIEDPFLVIEISDSSESEDEENLEA